MENSKDRLILKILPYLGILAVLVIWELIVDLGIVPNTLLASPIQVVKLFFIKLNTADPDGAVLAVHIATSLKEALLGYSLALIIGIPLGLAMGWFVIVEGLARPIFEMIRPIPPVAWIPLAIFWFGIGLTGKAFIIWASGVVPCVINSFVGVRMTNPTFIRMARTYGASDWEIFKQICIPSALPMVFGGLQVALAASWTALVAAELIAADTGLGFLITMGRRLLMPDMIVLGMLMVGLTGVVIGVIVDKVEKRLVAGVRR
ncbi:ABC transporter permease [Desulforamulus aeronauticus]|uniref:NitT/TauT family transport system permease protein n=1 Tax=Desulforamulus aeronauticus DSM 10349 TaxID=1121421 RepID=A0A1M6SI90_9FIRM|nr:ABC transporter permease [Desulforamulus aeronauticus]SHK44433.1 NitT/TauT family transport system permease protein [Desulforamulus aeronauticus DSM 10349]